MASPPDLGLNPDPSSECRPHLDLGQPFAHRRCHFDGKTESFVDWLRRPDLDDSAVIGGRDYAPAGVTPGFSQGYPLLQYALDWGDCTARILRKLAHVSILKGWPRRQDRAHALVLLARYVAKGDDCDPPLVTYLIHAEPFAGWTWDAKALRLWLDRVEIDAGCNSFTGGLAPADALAAAAAWCSHAATLWADLTSETFPYDERQMVQLWLENPPAPTLPHA